MISAENGDYSVTGVETRSALWRGERMRAVSNDAAEPDELDELDEAEAWRIVERCVGVTYAHMRWLQERGEVLDGSPIDEDDRVFSVMSMREMVRGSIVAALDCLLLACWSLDKGHAVRGHGHAALVRSSLSASTTALWLLDDDQDERRLRGLQLARAQCLAEREHVENIAPGFLVQGGPPVGPFVESRRQRVAKVIEDGAALGFGEAMVKAKPKDKTMVKLGGDRIPPDLLPGGDPGAHVLSEWRLLSARAHGFQWPIKYGADEQPHADDPRFVTMNVAVSPDRILGSIRIALIAGRVALDRYAELAGLDPLDDVPAPWLPATWAEQSEQ